MAKKEELSAGLANLLSGADQSVKQQKAEPTQPQDYHEGNENSEAPETIAEPIITQGETDLINSIGNEEVREELKRRLLKKKMIGRGRPRKNDQLGSRMDGYGRTSIIIPLEKWEKIKEIALRETLTIKEIVELALDIVIERYESKHGEVKPQPARPKRDINEIF